MNNLRYNRPRPVAEINITPFTDVILVLLIIFMVTTPLLSQSGLNINLPKASSAGKLHLKSQVSVILNSEGIVYLDEEPVTNKELKSQITALYKENPSISVIVSADKDCSFKDFSAILDILNGLGISRLAVAASK